MKHTDGIELSRKEFKKEHVGLIHKLKHPTKASLGKEAKEQSAEMKRALGKRKK